MPSLEPHFLSEAPKDGFNQELLVQQNYLFF